MHGIYFWIGMLNIQLLTYQSSQDISMNKFLGAYSVGIDIKKFSLQISISGRLKEKV